MCPLYKLSCSSLFVNVSSLAVNFGVCMGNFTPPLHGQPTYIKYPCEVGYTD